MHDSGEYSVSNLMVIFGIGSATVYRCLNRNLPTTETLSERENAKPMPFYLVTQISDRECGSAQARASAHRNISAFEPDSKHTDHDAARTRGTSFLEHSSIALTRLPRLM